jgi:nitroreductase
MDFLELAKSRCTTRGFTDKAISKEDLDKILFVGHLAPSACNRQPQRIIVVQQPDNILKVQKAYQTFGSRCVLIVCQEKRNALIRPFDGKCSGDMVGLFDPRIIRKEFNVPEYIEPTALLILGYPSKGFLSPERYKTERKPLENTVMYESYKEKV